MTSPREPIAWDGKPITLWRGDHYEGDSFFLSESKHQRREEWKALPAAQYAALAAYAKTGEAVEGVLIEANEDDGTMTPADVVRALVAERDALRAKVEAVAIECADLCRARADEHHAEGESLRGLEKVIMLTREASALACENAILSRRTALGAERAT